MFPTFLCIGAQRAGTTWLQQAFSIHPQIWTPPIKELHYFDLKALEPAVIALAREPLMRYRLKQLLRVFLREAYKGKDIRWKLRYFFALRTDRWYQSLFWPEAGQIAGEITPEYSILDRDAIVAIHRLLPDLKIILLLRNPIERTWSQANRNDRVAVAGGRHTNESILHKFMQEDHPHQRSMYGDILENWESVYPLEQIYIGFFKQIGENPMQMLSDIYQFLEIDCISPNLYPPSIAEKVHAGAQKERLPAHWGKFLAQQYHEQIVQLHDRFANDATIAWVKSAESYLTD